MNAGKRWFAPATAREGARDPLTAERARLAAASFARGVVWAGLTVSLLETVVTAPYLPSPWGRPVLLLALLGGLVSGLVTLYRLFIAFLALLALGRVAVPGRLRTRSKPAPEPTRPQEEP
ncbi:hypothetical protein ACFWVF_29080 [Streptomyces sp. NPDC058659]|uniref:hypothetical protein n=1 Tax=Streptomyces sp. NPDC058659 TaxID=3346581 RepID=UPI00365E0F8C